MTTEIGKYIEERRKIKALSIRQLAEKSGISHTEVWRLETGERKKPSPDVLKSLAPHLGISYEDLMKKAGYIDEAVDHPSFTETVYRDEKNNVVDIVTRAKDMYEKDSEWANLAYRVSVSALTSAELAIIKAQTKTLLEQFLKNKK